MRTVGHHTSTPNIECSEEQLVYSRCLRGSGSGPTLPLEPRRQPSVGGLHLVLGPMFSGKSTELQRLMRRHSLAGRRVLVVKHRRDLRYSDDEQALLTADGHAMAAVPVESLAELDDSVWHAAHVIGIDEGQFYDDLVSFVHRALDAGKLIVVAALDGTFERKAFGAVLSLVPLADSVTKLLAVCSRCGADAPFTMRLGDERETRLIGGADKYMAVCRGCYADSRINARLDIHSSATS